MPTELPDKHGESDDPRYPSPRQLRQAIAFVIDLVLHIAVGVVGMIVCLDIPAVSDWAPLALPIGWILASLLQRVVAQRIFHTTVGKALAACVSSARPTGSGRPPATC